MKAKSPDTAVIVHADLDTTQEGLAAVQEGAFSIVQEPLQHPGAQFPDQAGPGEAGAEGCVRGGIGVAAAPGLARDVYQPYNFIGESEEIKKVFGDREPRWRRPTRA